MSTASKRKGSGFELDLLNHFRDNGFEAERLRLAGKLDEGDLSVRDTGQHIVIEAKAEAKYDLPGYLRELAKEKVNYANARRLEPARVTGLVIVKRRMASIGDCFVVQTVDDWFGIGAK